MALGLLPMCALALHLQGLLPIRWCVSVILYAWLCFCDNVRVCLCVCAWRLRVCVRVCVNAWRLRVCVRACGCARCACKRI